MTLSALLLMLTPAVAGSELLDASKCGIFPAKVMEYSIYGGMSDCYLSEIGERPLWHGLPADHVQTMRFTFVHGHSLFFRSVRIDTLPNGRGRMVVDGTNRRGSIKQQSRRIGPRKVKLSAEQMAELNRLVEASGTFEHDIGTWDNTGDEGAIFLHCQTLDLERANAEGYRMSSVNIGCNHPTKLMPLIEEIVRLAKLKQIGEGTRAYY